MNEIDAFIELLRGQAPGEFANGLSPWVFNPWRDCDGRDAVPRREMPARRRENLAAYLEARRETARVLLLGEAPSHRGCRFTGIAFCSETELVARPHLVARHRLQLTSADPTVQPQRERSAAVIWSEIERTGKPFEVVLWNAFPWHPYSGDGVKTNRKPKPAEVMRGRAPFEAMLRCFTRKLHVFAVGKVAEDALRRWGGFECAGYIRHPAQGGEKLFREQFRRLVEPRL